MVDANLAQVHTRSTSATPARSVRESNTMSTPAGPYTVAQAAKILGVSPDSIRRWCEPNAHGVTELLSTRTAGGHRRIAADAIDAFIVTKLRQYSPAA